MECYELYIPSPPKRSNGKFQKGLIPHNKGRKMTEWMDPNKIPKVLGCLEIGRKMGNRKLPGANKIPIVGIKDGKITAFASAPDAAKILKAKGFAVNTRNITDCISQKQHTLRGKYTYVRKRAAGYQWFRSSDTEKYRHLIN